jgi:chromosome partitioning protein
MGVVVAFVSQKGGVGKSTLAWALAREAAAGGLRVKVADLDIQQGTLVNWQRRRLAANREPSVSVESFRSAGSALNGRGGYDLLVLDGPARANSATLEIARSADLVVQPTGASLDDLEPAVLTFHELVREGISREKLLFALCRVQTEARCGIAEATWGKPGTRFWAAFFRRNLPTVQCRTGGSLSQRFGIPLCGSAGRRWFRP